MKPLPSNKITLVLLLCAALLSAKTRWSTNRIIPDADFYGSGELVIGYEASIRSDSTISDLEVAHFVPVTLGVSEWFNTSIGWAEGVTVGLKGRILDEYRPAMPSMAIGVRNLYHNSMLGKSGVENDTPEVTGEVYLAMSKGFESITTRFHGGIASIPTSTTEQFNGFFGVEKYFGGAFYLTFEGWSFADRFNMALFGTLRFLPEDRAEFYAGIVDIERALFDRESNMELSLEPDSEFDMVKPGIQMGFRYNFSFPFGSRTQFRTVEDLYEEQQSQINQILRMQDSLSNYIEEEQMRSDELGASVDSLGGLIVPVDTLPEFYNEIYARMILYRKGYENEPFDPEEVRVIRSEIFAFEDQAEQSLIHIVINGDRNSRIEMDAVSLLGMMKSNKSVPVLLDRLGSEMDRRMKIEIISALGSIGDRGATYALEQLALSSDRIVAATAAEVLTQWSESNGTSDEPVSSGSGEFIIE